MNEPQGIKTEILDTQTSKTSRKFPRIVIMVFIYSRSSINADSFSTCYPKAEVTTDPLKRSTAPYGNLKRHSFIKQTTIKFNEAMPYTLTNFRFSLSSNYVVVSLFNISVPMKWERDSI